MGLFDREPVICPICNREIKKTGYRKRRVADGVICGECYNDAAKEMKINLLSPEIKRFTVEELNVAAKKEQARREERWAFFADADVTIGNMSINTKLRKWRWGTYLYDTVAGLDFTTIYDVFDFDDVEHIKTSSGRVTIMGDTTVTNNGLGRAVVGGLLAGSTGAIIGASTAKQTMHQEAKSSSFYSVYMKLKPYPGRTWDFTFDNAADMQKVMDILGANQKAQALPAQQQAPATSDPAEELRKYKALADEGVITAEDYEAKKKQLLGL